MPIPSFIVRDPLIDQQQNVLGYQICLTNGENSPLHLDCLARLYAAGETPVARVPSYIIDMGSHAIAASIPPAQTVLALHADAMTNQQTLAVVESLRGQGYGIYIRQADVLPLRDPALSVASHVEIRFESKKLPAVAATLAESISPMARIVVRGVSDWDQFASCVAVNEEITVLASHLANAKRPLKDGVQLAANQLLILEMMQMVQHNATMTKIETHFKKDPALTFKLLQLLSSPPFRRATPTTTIRQAVAVLGYRSLYRWLAVLLSNSNATNASPFLIQAALTRARFCELLGADLSESDRENLFMAGLLSAFELLLGIPMDKVLSHLAMPDAISEAILHCKGPYGAYLALALTCEVDAKEAARLASELSLESKGVNLAHLDAIAWTQALDI